MRNKITRAARGVFLTAGIFAAPLLAFEAWPQGLTAVIQVNATPHYLANQQSAFGGLSLTRAYAPLPVFFEGWQSSPRQTIVDYRWDFGDGSPESRGFNAAHVFENPGTYTVTLTVEDTAGATASTTIPIEALPRDGATYYVNSAIGNDNNSGLSPVNTGTPGQGPWRTATHAFRQLEAKKYGPGASILFNRGQTFELQTPTATLNGSWAGHSILFGAYGAGPKPVIQYVGSDPARIIRTNSPLLAHLALVDLDFNMLTPQGARGDEIVVGYSDTTNLLFLRLGLQKFTRGITLDGGVDANQISGVFVVECDFFDSEASHVYARCHRYVLLRNTFDFSGNHLAYLSYLDKGVVVDNVFSRPAFGRNGLRISGTLEGSTTPTNNVYVGGNAILGWVDPVVGGPTHGDGIRYNFQLVNLGPNKLSFQWLSDIVFERNIVSNAETFVQIADIDNLTVRNNQFVSASPYSASKMLVGFPEWEQKPLRNVSIVGNTFVLAGYPNGGANAVFEVNAYSGPSFQGLTSHQNLLIANNIVQIVSGNSRMQILSTGSATLLNALTSNNNLYYSPSTVNGLFQVGGTFQGNGTVYSLAQWQSTFGKDTSSLHAPPLLEDVLGPDNVFSGQTVFDEDLRPANGSPALNAGMNIPTLAYDFETKRRPSGGGYDIGAFEGSLALDVNIDGQGSVAVTPSLYDIGYLLTLEAVPAARWEFVEWSGDLTGSNNPETLLLDAEKSVTAHFDQAEFVVDVTVVGDGFVDVSPPGPYARDTVVTLTATPDPPAIFLQWQGDAAGTDPSVDVTLDTDKAVTAVFTQKEYLLNVNVIGAGAVSITPDPPYSYQDVVQLTALPNADQQFVGYSGDLVSSLPVQSIIMDSNKNITATFSKDDYTLNLSTVGLGSVFVYPLPPYTFNEQVFLAALPGSDYYFAGWTGSLTGTQTPTSILMNEDKNIIAYFSPITYSVTVTKIGQGLVDLSPLPPYAKGQAVTLTAEPSFGWAFERWGGALGGGTNPAQLVITGDTSVIANFADESLHVAIPGAPSDAPPMFWITE